MEFNYMKPFPVEYKGNEEFTALGAICGIGSMLIGCYQAGFKVIGNYDWRKYYRRKDEDGINTFEQNFGVPFHGDWSEIPEEVKQSWKGVTIMCGHEDCGNFSNLNRNCAETCGDPGRIPDLIANIAEVRPRFFFFDNLPKSLQAVPMDYWHKMLPDYDLYPEWVSNYHYGNMQKNRKRMFMIGALKEEKFVFRPNEFHNQKTMDWVYDIPEGTNNHLKHDTTKVTGRATGLHEVGEHYTWGDVQEYFQNKPNGTILEYFNKDGEPKKRMGLNKGRDEYGYVATGTNPCINHHTNLPQSLRERARQQGCPDDFKFYGTVIEEDGTWNHDRNSDLIRQTGKFMPVEFCYDFAYQVMCHLKGTPCDVTNKRLIPRNLFVDKAKIVYCGNVGYGELQEEACKACWLSKDCPVKDGKYEEFKDNIDELIVIKPRSTRSRKPGAPRRSYTGVPKVFDSDRFRPVNPKSKLAIVVNELRAGKTIPEVAEILGSSIGNVRSHISNLFNQYGIGYKITNQKVEIDCPVDIFGRDTNVEEK